MENIDLSGNAYFSSLKQKAISGAVNDAREATKQGDMGERQSDAKIRLTELATQVIAKENVRNQGNAKSNKDLELVKIECLREQEIKRVEGDIAPKKRETELQMELNRLEAEKQTEFLRATELAQTVVYTDETRAKLDVERVMRHIDINQNGLIDYNGIFL